jgi:hypothetical protein
MSLSGLTRQSTTFENGLLLRSYLTTIHSAFGGMDSRFRGNDNLTYSYHRQDYLGSYQKTCTLGQLEVAGYGLFPLPIKPGKH